MHQKDFGKVKNKIYDILGWFVDYSMSAVIAMEFPIGKGFFETIADTHLVEVKECKQMEVNMNIDLRKNEMLLQLQKLRKECEILIERTYTYREDLLNVKNEEETRQFDETHDLEEGLEIIRLF